MPAASKEGVITRASTVFGGSLLLAAGLLLGACERERTPEAEALPRPVELRAGTRFFPAGSFDAPLPERIQLPLGAGANAVWGATGRDDRGRIHVGVSSHGDGPQTAWLYRFDPATGALSAQGDVLGELERAGLRQPGMSQNKLHSKIVQANDGYLYFSSFDEEGETATVNPRWGGHLWRKRPDDQHWEHLLATPEALIAVNTTGRHVYALGYWDHVLYRYDTVDGSTRRVRVGSVAGHISRNFLVDLDENAWVPRVVATAAGPEVSLVQYDPRLQAVASIPLPAYASARMAANEGIVAHATLRDGTIAFLAGDGRLFTLAPAGADGERLRERGFLHPEGRARVSSLFSFNGDSLLAGVGKAAGARGPWEWVIHELASGVAAAEPLTGLPAGGYLLYGSLTRDDAGAFYVAGRFNPPQRGGNEPLLLRLRP